MNYWLISGIILGVGFIICLFLILRSKWKVSRKNIDDYEEGRNKLTYRKKKEVNVLSSAFSGFSLSNLIGGFIVIIIGVTLLPMVAEQVSLAQNTTITSNVSSVDSVSSTMMGLVTLFFALAIAFSAIGIVFSGLRGSGLL
jgi:hypothetical protein